MTSLRWDKAALAVRVRELRHERGLSQARLAAAAEMTRSHICALEEGRAGVSLAVLDGLAAALGVDEGELLQLVGHGERAG